VQGRQGVPEVTVLVTVLEVGGVYVGKGPRGAAPTQLLSQLRL
jgi:hypothetical protein